MNVRGLSIALIFGLVARQASAQSYSSFAAETDFSFGYGGLGAGSVTLAFDSAGPYSYFYEVTGDASNFGQDYDYFFDGLGSGAVFATGSSSATNGTATAFQGEAIYLTMTNTSLEDGATFTVFADVIAHTHVDSGDSGSNAYGGIQEFANNDPFGFFHSTLSGGGTWATDAGGSFAEDGNSIPNNYFEAKGSLGGDLAPGQSIQVAIWASGSSYANAVPEPATIGLGLVGFAAFLRRRRKGR